MVIVIESIDTNRIYMMWKITLIGKLIQMQPVSGDVILSLRLWLVLSLITGAT